VAVRVKTALAAVQTAAAIVIASAPAGVRVLNLKMQEKANGCSGS